MRSIKKLFSNKREDRERELTRNLVARYSRGNLSLRRGLYTTREDIEKRREEIAKYKFPK